jgi:hypothetical protein
MECDRCGAKAKTEVYRKAGTVNEVENLCKYCALDPTYGRDVRISTIGAMFNELEQFLRRRMR